MQWKKNKEFKESKLLSNDPSATNVKIHVLYKTLMMFSPFNHNFLSLVIYKNESGIKMSRFSMYVI